ncbi:MAG: hypothetical protein NUW37_03985 [Planctomycetes bacterium]|nr:hypothetical protein [Planctomycetota bacterium]
MPAKDKTTPILIALLVSFAFAEGASASEALPDFAVRMLRRAPLTDYAGPDSDYGQRSDATFIAEIVNQGANCDQRFRVTFKEDGGIREHIPVDGLASGAVIRFAFRVHRKSAENERAIDTEISVAVDSENLIAEFTKENNEIATSVQARSSGFYVHRSFARTIEGAENSIGTKSFHDWLNAHVRELNRLYRESGEASDSRANERSILRVDYVNFVSDDEQFESYEADRKAEVRWDFHRLFASKDFLPRMELPADVRLSDIHARSWIGRYADPERVQSIDYSLLHELGHGLGLVDLYAFRVFGREVPRAIREEFEIGIDDEIFSPRVNGLMGNDYRAGLSNHSAHALALNSGARLHPADRSRYGSVLTIVPGTVKLEIMSGGAPASSANVSVHHSERDPSLGYYGRRFHETPDEEGYADERGVYVLGKKPFGSDFYSPSHPFYRPAAGVTMVLIRFEGRREIRFVAATDLNASAIESARLRFPGELFRAERQETPARTLRRHLSEAEVTATLAISREDD